MKWPIASHFVPQAAVSLYLGDCQDFLRQLPAGSVQLIVTSPPYNIGKQYESRLTIDDYLELQKRTLALATRSLAESGSLCWQVGNHVAGGEIYPLDLLLYPICKDLGLKLRNR